MSDKKTDISVGSIQFNSTDIQELFYNKIPDFVYIPLRCKLPSWLTRLGIIDESHYRYLVTHLDEFIVMYSFKVIRSFLKTGKLFSYIFIYSFKSVYHYVYSKSRLALQSLLKSFNATSEIDIDELDLSKVIKLSLCYSGIVTFYYHLYPSFNHPCSSID